MADRTGEAILRDVIALPGKAGIRHDVRQAMTLGAHAVRSVGAEIGIRKCIGNQSAGRRRLAELVVVLQNMRVDGAMRTVRSASAKLAIVVAVCVCSVARDRLQKMPSSSRSLHDRQLSIISIPY